MEQVHIKIGKNLHRIRKGRGLSLDKLAEITGVSKAMLGQIERGESNPTVTTLWKIANGMRISFSSLVEQEAPSISVVRLDEIPPVVEEGGAYKVYTLFPFDQEKRFEVYTIDLDPGCIHYSEAHSPGVQEYVIVSHGTLNLMLGGETYTVEEGNAIRFPSDAPHEYRNESKAQARIQVVIYYPALKT
ncbi:helix-turn-helix domain-containing protein [Aneurinibacillus tyrosinisolvens]|uniref:helix-turn-helix domain-containing protein n=1 Tax=Aneurinibacillus tyrosinisolvens TaxID=1443435 RepID=UPI00063F89C1|nr:XRE family transcriptional regulator [Aneurinibacillus tyrosinisolvens]